MRIKKNKYLRYLLVLAGLFSLILALAGKWQVAGALWVAIICLLPSVWVALRTSYLGLKIFCTTALITQVITAPVFYLQADRYAFGGHRPFGFTAMEALPIFLVLGLFLWLVACLVILCERVVGAPVQWADASLRAGGSALSAGAASRQTIFVIGIILLIAISLPVKLWMFEMGIGLTGAPSPQLPYRLSGILFYVFNSVIPLCIGYLYLKTHRKSLALALIISVYAVVIGLTAVSKGIVLLTIAPIIAFAWLDRRWAILGVSGFLVAFGVMVAAASREIVHISDGLTTGSFTGLGVLGTLVEVMARLEWSPEMLLIFADIAGRVEGFQGLLLASQFNPDTVGGAWAIFAKSINGNWADLGHDAMHLEYLGYTIPMGFYGVAASLNAWMLMAANQNLLMMLPFVLYAALTFVILEKMLMRIAHKYRLPLPLAQAVLFFVTLWFYTGPGTLEFRVLFTLSIVFGLLPALRLGHISQPVRIAME